MKLKHLKQFETFIKQVKDINKPDIDENDDKILMNPDPDEDDVF